MKRCLIALTIALMLGVASVAMADTYTIAISQIVEHPALDAARQGFKDYLKEKGLDVKYSEYIAQGKIDVANQIASTIQGEKPDLILTIATPTSQACAQKIKDIPIVATAITDFVGAGLAADTQKPGGNVTGMTDMMPMDKHVGLIKEFIPGVKTVGVMYNSGEANSVTSINQFKEAAAAQGIAVEEATVINSSGVYQAAMSLVGKCEAMYVPTDNTVVSALESAIKVATENDLPLFSGDTDSVERGTLASLGFDYYGMGYQTGAMAEKILVDGANPGDMPIETLQNLKLFINKTAAAGMGVTIPEALLNSADQIIE